MNLRPDLLTTTTSTGTSATSAVAATDATGHRRPAAWRRAGMATRVGAALAVIAGGALLAPGTTAAAPPSDLAPLPLPPAVIEPAPDPLPFPLPPIELPTPEIGPIGPGDLTFPMPDECLYEYAADHFSVEFDRDDDDPTAVVVDLAYDTGDVCEWTVWIAVSAGDDPLGETTVTMTAVAAATAVDGFLRTTFDATGACDVVAAVAVEESLPLEFALVDDCADPAPPTDPADEPADTDPADTEPADTDPVDAPGDPAGPPAASDDADRAGAGGLVRTATPGSIGGGLPSTGTDSTTLLLGVGLLTLGAGSIAALVTRRRFDSHAA